MSTTHERRAEMRADNLETAHGLGSDLPECDRCEMSMTSYIAGTGICTRCHNRLYGAGHRPAAVLKVGTGWFPFCIVPACSVLTGMDTLPHQDPGDATEESRRLHREAIHGPTDRDLPSWVRAS